MDSQKWQVQKGLVLIVSITAMALAALKTAVTFEKKRTELFKEEEKKADKKHPEKKGKALAAPKPALPPAKSKGK